MPAVLQKLKKVLTQEQELGFQDRAVIGGLSKFVSFCQREADAREQALTRKAAGLLENYGGLPIKRRQEVIKELLAELAQASLGLGSPAKKTAGAAAYKETEVSLDAPISSLKGVSVMHAKQLSRLGVKSIRDLLYLFPRRHDDFSALKTIDHLSYGEETTIIGTIRETSCRPSRKANRAKDITTAIVVDGTGSIEARWFNQPYLVNRLKIGHQVALSGKVSEYNGRLVLSSPVWEPLDRELIHTARLVPVYPLTQGLFPRWLRRLVKKVLDTWSPHLVDHLPPSIRERRGLMDLPMAIANIHFPESGEQLEAARRRLAFDEFLFIQIGVMRQRRRWQARAAKPLPADRNLLNSFIASLPFPLTKAQERVLGDILADMESDRPMNRLLQGDVGSGKTVIATMALITAVANSCQGALMVPTEILAEQHTRSISGFLKRLPNPPSVALLTGSLRAAEKEQLLKDIAQGLVDIVIGTHALFQEGVIFRDLGLAIIDEQHRFGVLQRAAIRQKGYNPHALVMSATPIPRTLALTIYGDLDISVIDELPPGRQEIITNWLSPPERERAYFFIQRQVEQGHQAFIICPLIQESGKLDAPSATAEYDRLQREVFPHLRLGLLHGRMPAEEKDKIMGQFQRRELDILVSTSVLEVGIDVPNATVILVEGADRFGLSQLHQLRGRVGRGEYQSYCILLADCPSEEAQRRLGILTSTQDGFTLAEEDLRLRGPGEFFGTRQSGLPPLRMATLADLRTLEEAREEAQRLFREDPELEAPKNRLLAQTLQDFWHGVGEIS